jgi:AraC-like DNA-binding protein
VVLTRSGVFVKHTGAGDRRQVVADPTRALFFNRGEPYRVSHPAPGGDDCTVLAIPAALLAEVVAEHDPAARDREDAPFGVAHAPLVRAGAPSALEAEEEVLAIVRDVVRDGYAARRARAAPVTRRALAARRDLADAVRVMVATWPDAKLSLTALARAAGCSPFHLARTFRREVGIPVHQYRLRLRLALALDRLASGEDNLSALALDLGFSSHSHFATLFRRTFGAPPSAFRRTLGAARPREPHTRKTVHLAPAGYY